jgi:translation elongation factor EF-4
MNLENIRNFSIIAPYRPRQIHACRQALEKTGTIDFPKKMMPQFLDSMDVEREKALP